MRQDANCFVVTIAPIVIAITFLPPPINSTSVSIYAGNKIRTTRNPIYQRAAARLGSLPLTVCSGDSVHFLSAP
jgi:hypothetical protein